MRAEFDRSAPGGGVETKCRLENGKAFLEWRFHLTDRVSGTENRQPQERPLRQAAEEQGRPYTGQNRPACPRPTIRISLMDGEGNLAVEGMQMVGEEEPLETVLVQPRLWQGIKDPFLYEAEAILAGQGVCADRVRMGLCLRCLEAGGEGRVLLNGQPIEVRAVAYSLPDTGSEAERRSQAIWDFGQLVRLGANSICLEEKESSAFLMDLCDRFGFLVFEKGGGEDQELLVSIWNRAVRVRRKEEGRGEGLPAYRGGSDAFFLPDRKCPTSLYYKYKAKWSREPFVYLVPESVRRLKSGSYAVTCYSSCSRVALYTDGELFEFRRGDREFVFQEIPARTPCLRLSAEGEGCSAALSLHKSFVRTLEENGGSI